MMTAVSRVTEILAVQDKSVPWISEAMGGLADALALGATLSMDWTKSRRKDLRSALPDDFQCLASEDLPVGYLGKTWRAP